MGRRSRTISPPPTGRAGSTRPAAGLSGLGPGGPVIYASDLTGPGVKERLVRRLLAGLPGQETDDRLGAGEPGNRPGPAAPHAGGQPGPAVSFSLAAGHVWAALAPTGQVGVDAALPSEFEAGYPLARAFRAVELDWARPLSGGDTAGAAALLWALKEAAVKALGVGFHLLDPLAVEVSTPAPGRGDSGRVKAGPILPAWARPEAAAGWPWPGIIEGKLGLAAAGENPYCDAAPSITIRERSNRSIS